MRLRRLSGGWSERSTNSGAFCLRRVLRPLYRLHRKPDGATLFPMQFDEPMQHDEPRSPEARSKELRLAAPRTIRWAMLGLLVAGFLAGCRSSAVSPGDVIPFRTLARGYQSGVSDAGVVVARDEDAWRALWRRHAATVLPRPEPPAVDFEREMVVGVTLGTRSTGGFGVEVARVVAAEDGLFVEATERAPAPGAMVPQVITQPFHMVAVPRREGDVRLSMAPRQGSSRE